MLGVVDIGGTKIATARVDASGALVDRREEPTAPELGFDHALSRIRAMMGQVDGVSIGTTGPVDRETGVYGKVDLLPGWEGRSLRAAFDVPVVIENDADCAALGEATSGAGRGVGRFVYVTVSTGIGGGIVLDGAIYRGANGAHPEIGHHMIEASGPPCPCGARGCWEVLASGPALAREGLDAAGVCHEARRGTEWARVAVERVAFYLGVGVANVMTAYAPRTIALGGGVMKSYELFIDRIREVVGRCVTLVPPATIVPASLGADAVLHGAVRAFALERGAS